MKNAYKYRGGIGVFDLNGQSTFERDVNTLVNNQIYLPSKNDLNDPTEGFYNDSFINTILKTLSKVTSTADKIAQAYAELLEKIADTGVYSLSNTVDNELLWAYYANGHTGFAIEYDIDTLKHSINHNKYFQFIYDFDVKYSKDIPVADVSILQGANLIKTLEICLGTKSLSWRHEKEYRLIVEGKGLFDIDYRAVTGIYFGYRMQDAEIEFIMNKLKGRGVQYYKMELIEKGYKFQPKEIVDKYIDAPQYRANKLNYNIDELLLPENILGKEAYSYKDRLIEALEIVRYEPLITEIYIATIALEAGVPIFKIWAYTGKTPPTKAFFFKLDDKNKLIKLY